MCSQSAIRCAGPRAKASGIAAAESRKAELAPEAFDRIAVTTYAGEFTAPAPGSTMHRGAGPIRTVLGAASVSPFSARAAEL
jgi:hypothetical protein